MESAVPISPPISIAICTWNRAPLLEMTLERLCEITLPVGERCEILVVDNASTDCTPQLIRRYQGRLPLRAIRETRQGISHARNAALREAQGEYLVFIDDDVLVSHDWLPAYLTAFRSHPDSGLFGGPIRARFLGSPPAWLIQSFDLIASAFAIRELGAEPFPLASPGLPYGANMAFRLDQARHYSFDPILGRVRKGMVGGEEIAFMARMMANGVEGWWVPDAAVEHLLPEHRQTLRYVGGYFEGLGITQFRSAEQVKGKFEFLGVPSWLWRQYLAAQLRYWRARLSSPVTVWMPHFERMATYRGWVKGYRDTVES